MRVVLLGPPGAGKGTQAKLIVDALRLNHISTGDIFRRVVADGGKEGARIQAILSSGGLMPDAETASVVETFLTKQSFWDSFLLDGFPRTVPQAESFDAMLDKRGKRLDAVVAIDLSEKIVLERLGGRKSCPSCGNVYHETAAPPAKTGVCDRDGAGLVTREDDQPQKIIERLRVYESQTRPLIEYYTRSGVLKRVDGAVSAGEVTARILALFDK